MLKVKLMSEITGNAVASSDCTVLTATGLSTARTQKALSCNAFSSYTGRVHRAPVRTYSQEISHCLALQNLRFPASMYPALL